MISIKGKKYRFISVFILTVFLCQNLVWAEPAISAKQTNSSSLASIHQSITPNTISIPEQHGRVEKTKDGSKQPLVVLIKDAHCVYEVQQNITEILKTLIANYQLDFVGVEGATGLVNPAILLENNPAPELVAKVTDKYLRNGLLTAAEVLSANKGINPGFTIWGVEDLKLYLNNYQAFQDTLKTNKEALESCSTLASFIEKAKKEIFPNTLKEFDNLVIQYKKDKLSLSDFLLALSKREDLPQDLPQLEKIIQTAKLEKELTLDKVTKERDGLVKYLSTVLPKEEIQKLIRKSLLFKTNKLTTLDFYIYLEQLIPEAADFAFPSNLSKYIELLKLQSEIDNNTLFIELDRATESIYKSLCPGKIIWQIHSYDKALEITKKMLMLQANRQEISEFEKNKQYFVISSLIRFLNIAAQDQKLKAPAILNDKQGQEKLTKALNLASNFYSLAKKRDTALVNNLLRTMKKNQINKAGLICGGFHAEGIKTILEEKGINHQVICPLITKIQPDCHELYLNRMLNEKINPQQMLIKYGLTNIQALLATSTQGQEAGLHHPVAAELAAPHDRGVITQPWRRSRQRTETLAGYPAVSVEPATGDFHPQGEHEVDEHAVTIPLPGRVRRRTTPERTTPAPGTDEVSDRTATLPFPERRPAARRTETGELTTVAAEVQDAPAFNFTGSGSYAQKLENLAEIYNIDKNDIDGLIQAIKNIYGGLPEHTLLSKYRGALVYILRSARSRTYGNVRPVSIFHALQELLGTRTPLDDLVAKLEVTEHEDSEDEDEKLSHKTVMIRAKQLNREITTFHAKKDLDTSLEIIATANQVGIDDKHIGTFAREMAETEGIAGGVSELFAAPLEKQELLENLRLIAAVASANGIQPLDIFTGLMTKYKLADDDPELADTLQEKLLDLLRKRTDLADFLKEHAALAKEAREEEEKHTRRSQDTTIRDTITNMAKEYCVAWYRHEYPQALELIPTINEILFSDDFRKHNNSDGLTPANITDTEDPRIRLLHLGAKLEGHSGEATQPNITDYDQYHAALARLRNKFEKEIDRLIRMIMHEHKLSREFTLREFSSFITQIANRKASAPYTSWAAVYREYRDDITAHAQAKRPSFNDPREDMTKRATTLTLAEDYGIHPKHVFPFTKKIEETLGWSLKTRQLARTILRLTAQINPTPVDIYLKALNPEGDNRRLNPTELKDQVLLNKNVIEKVVREATAATRSWNNSLTADQLCQLNDTELKAWPYTIEYNIKNLSDESFREFYIKLQRSGIEFDFNEEADTISETNLSAFIQRYHSLCWWLARAEEGLWDISSDRMEKLKTSAAIALRGLTERGIRLMLQLEANDLADFSNKTNFTEFVGIVTGYTARNLPQEGQAIETLANILCQDTRPDTTIAITNQGVSVSTLNKISYEHYADLVISNQLEMLQSIFPQYRKTEQAVSAGTKTATIGVNAKEAQCLADLFAKGFAGIKAAQRVLINKWFMGPDNNLNQIAYDTFLLDFSDDLRTRITKKLEDKRVKAHKTGDIKLLEIVNAALADINSPHFDEDRLMDSLNYGVCDIRYLCSRDMNDHNYIQRLYEAINPDPDSGKTPDYDMVFEVAENQIHLLAQEHERPPLAHLYLGNTADVLEPESAAEKNELIELEQRRIHEKIKIWEAISKIGTNIDTDTAIQTSIAAADNTAEAYKKEFLKRFMKIIHTGAVLMADKAQDNLESKCRGYLWERAGVGAFPSATHASPFAERIGRYIRHQHDRGHLDILSRDIIDMLSPATDTPINETTLTDNWNAYRNLIERKYWDLAHDHRHQFAIRYSQLEMAAEIKYGLHEEKLGQVTKVTKDTLTEQQSPAVADAYTFTYDEGGTKVERRYCFMLGGDEHRLAIKDNKTGDIYLFSVDVDNYQSLDRTERDWQPLSITDNTIHSVHDAIIRTVMELLDEGKELDEICDILTRNDAAAVISKILPTALSWFPGDYWNDGIGLLSKSKHSQRVTAGHSGLLTLTVAARKITEQEVDDLDIFEIKEIINDLDEVVELMKDIGLRGFAANLDLIELYKKISIIKNGDKEGTQKGFMSKRSAAARALLIDEDIFDEELDDTALDKVTELLSMLDEEPYQPRVNFSEAQIDNTAASLSGPTQPLTAAAIWNEIQKAHLNRFFSTQDHPIAQYNFMRLIDLLEGDFAEAKRRETRKIAESIGEFTAAHGPIAAPAPALTEATEALSAV